MLRHGWRMSWGEWVTANAYSISPKIGRVELRKTQAFDSRSTPDRTARRLARQAFDFPFHPGADGAGPGVVGEDGGLVAGAADGDFEVIGLVDEHAVAGDAKVQANAVL